VSTKHETLIFLGYGLGGLLVKQVCHYADILLLFPFNGSLGSSVSRYQFSIQDRLAINGPTGVFRNSPQDEIDCL
jgi:hypothetical protein